MRLVALFFVLSCCFSGCLSSKSGTSARWIGRDPSWYPMNLGQKGVAITAFTDSLAKEMGYCPIDVVGVFLLKGLQENHYRGAFIAFNPPLAQRERYDFSPPFLKLGPVLVVREDSPISSLSDLDQKIVAVNAYDHSVLLVQNCNVGGIKEYEHIGQILEEVSSGQVDVALVPILDAQDYISSRFSSLKIASAPLDDAGIRLVVLKGEQKRLLKRFEKRLAKIKKSGRYDKLLAEYGLNGCVIPPHCKL